LRKALVGFATALLVLSGCADTGSAQDAKATLVEGLRNLLQADAFTQTIAVRSDVDSVVALGEGDIDEKTAAKILDSSITASGVQADDPAEASSLVVVNVAGRDDLEMRFVEGDLFMRADIGHLLETFGEHGAQLHALTAQVQGQPGFAWVRQALAGDWVVVRNALALSQQMGAPTASAEQQKEIVDRLLQSVQKNATVTSEGEDDVGEHLSASLPLRETLQDLVRSSGAAGGVTALLEQRLADVPDGDVAIDFWVADGSVSRIEIDITQFETMADQAGESFPEGVDDFVVVVEFDEFDGKVETVAKATEIDTVALMQALGGLLMGGAGAGAAPGNGPFDCSMLEGAPADVVELYAKECPELQK